MPVTVLLIVVIVLFVGLLFAADRAVKVLRRVRRRAEANRRLAAAAAEAEARDRQQKAAAEASTALTSVMPRIHDHSPRHVDLAPRPNAAAAPMEHNRQGQRAGCRSGQDGAGWTYESCCAG